MDELFHPYHPVRLAAVASLAEAYLDEPATLFDRLRASLADPHRSVRGAVAHALASAGLREAEVVEALLDVATRSPESEEGRRARLATLFALELVGRQAPSLDGEAFEACRAGLIPMLEHPLSHVRYQAFAALEALGADGPAYAEAAVKALGDRDEEVVAVAAEALARCGRGDAAEALAAAVGRLHGDALARGAVALSELASRGPEPTPWLDGLRAQLMAQSRRLPHGLPACEALGALGGAEAEAHLTRLAGGWFVHRLIRVAAAAALARAGRPEGLERLGALMRHRRRDARGLAIEHAGRWGGATLRPQLVAILRQPDDYHSDTAALALSHDGSAEAVEALCAALADERAEVRLEVARGLRRLGQRLELLEQVAATDPDPEVRAAACADPTDSPHDTLEPG